MVELIVISVSFLVLGLGLILIGVRAVVSPDLSFSRWVRVGDKEDEEVFGEWVVLWLVRIMGVVFVCLGVVTLGLGVLGVSKLF